MASDEGCISITWDIENFIILKVKKGWCLCSPVWKMEYTNRESSWWRLNADQWDSHIKFYLFNFQGRLPLTNKMSLVSSRGEFWLERNGIYYTVEKDVVFGKDRQSIRPNDTLTLLCKIKGKTIKNQIFRFSSILHSVDHLWKIENIASLCAYTTVIEHDNFLLDVSLTKQNKKGTRTVKVKACADRCLSFLDVSLSIDGDQRCVINNTCESPFVEWMCDLEIVSEKKGINLYIKSIVALHKICQVPKLPFSSKISKQKNDSKAVLGNSGALYDDLLLLYREGALSDATLNTEGKSFSAHRSVLAARSPVFRTMFEKDEMSEARSGVVDIDDVDSQTVGRMLVFLYSDSLEDMQWKEASELYYAADKYAVQPLKQKCADILKAGLTVNNVCDALILADKHLDKQLMKCSVDFIRDQQEILSSLDWKKLEKNNPYLIIEVFRKIFVKKETI